MVILIICFTGILIYYIIKPSSVDKVDVILTVIVGWLGLIIGGFFGEKAMESLEVERKVYAKETNLWMNKVNSFLDKVTSKLKEK